MDKKEIIREQANFERLVRRATDVKGRQGRRKKAQVCCPFHDDNDPSMSVDFEEGLYHCFACDAGGDIFQWVMRTRGVTFPRAMEWLIEEFHIDVGMETAQ